MSEPSSINTYQLIAFLLQYPTSDTLDVLYEVKSEINRIEQPSVQSNLTLFVNKLETTLLDDLEKHYIEQFDFGRGTNLYVTYLKLGEQRERGLELLKLKNFYQVHGFEMTDKELSDYLPLMLEFCGNVTVPVSNELLQMHEKAVQEIARRLSENSSYYSYLFDALLEHMQVNGILISELAPATN